MKKVTEQHILVVEDEQHMANSIRFVLSLENYLVSIAGNGRQAIETILSAKESDHPVDLVITDIWMPELSGLEMLKKLKRLKIHIPILVITAMDSQKVQQELSRFDCSGYMGKPFDDCTLLEKVADILKKNTMEM